MLFKPDLAEKVMSGQKLETRRLHFPHELAVKLHKLDDFLPATGKEWGEYSVNAIRTAIHRANRKLQFNTVELPICPGRGQKMLGRRPVYGLSYMRLQSITDAGIRAEGIEGAGPWDRLREFMKLWDSINTRRADRWAADPYVFVIQFEPIWQEGIEHATD